MVPLPQETLRKYNAKISKEQKTGENKISRQKQEAIRRQRKRHIIPKAPPTKRPVPTANTVSPYLKLPLFKGKERFLTILHEAHYFNDKHETFFQDEEKVQSLANALPTWEQVSERLGGDRPFIIGLDRCEEYQSQVSPVERLIGVSGMFATGTNLLADLLVNNCYNGPRVEAGLGAGVRWQVNWGKHVRFFFFLRNAILSFCCFAWFCLI